MSISPPELKHYDPRTLLGSWRGIEFRGYAPDSMIDVAPNADRATLELGCQGDGTRVMGTNFSAKLTVSLLASTSCNDQLSEALLEDRAFFTAVGPMLWTDLNGTTVLQATQAWLMRLPDIQYAKSAPVRKWQFECFDLIANVGGSIL